MGESDVYGGVASLPVPALAFKSHVPEGFVGPSENYPGCGRDPARLPSSHLRSYRPGETAVGMTPRQRRTSWTAMSRPGQEGAGVTGGTPPKAWIPPEPSSTHPAGNAAVLVGDSCTARAMSNPRQ